MGGSALLTAILTVTGADPTPVQERRVALGDIGDMAGEVFVLAHIAPAHPGDAVLHGVTPNGVHVALFSRTLDEITGSFPDLLAPLAALLPAQEGDAEGVGPILDGEIVPLQGERILPFQQLQQRLNRKTLSDAVLANVPAALVVYDALYADGKVLLTEPFEERRRKLEALPADGQTVRIAPSRSLQKLRGLTRSSRRPGRAAMKA